MLQCAAIFLESASYNGRFQMAEETSEQLAQRMADRPHHWTIGLSIGAIVVALGSAGVALYSAHFASLQYELAMGVREDAKQSAQKQASDLERTRTAAEKSADAADGSRDSARRSADIAQQQLQNSLRLFALDQRARVTLFSALRATDVIAGKSVRFRCEMKNTGKTPAVGFQGQMWINIKEKFTPDYPNVSQTSKGDIGAGASHFFDIEIPINQAQIDAFKAHTMRIFVYGKAEYTDTFNPKQIRHIQWCGSFPPVIAGIESTELDLCEVHNSSD